MQQPQDVSAVERDYFKTYIQLIHNAVGTHLFRNFYVRSGERGTFDSLDDGDNSCAFLVSSILTLMKKLQGGVHGTVDATVADLRESGWREVDGPPQAGDVLVWESVAGHTQRHIGFSLGNGRAVSNASSQKMPVEHDDHFDDQQRQVSHIFRFDNWE